MRKIYRATFLLGHSSASDDTDGAVTATVDALVPDRAAIEWALPQFVGSIRQRPPAHSAVKIRGQRAYKLARQGTAMELAPRTIVIHNIGLLHYEYPELRLSIVCGSGTYVRALGRDLAAALGTTAIMSALERSAVGEFHVEHAVHLQDLTTESLSSCLQPALTAVPDLPCIVLDDAQLADIRHGRPIAASIRQYPAPVEHASEWAAVDSAGRLAAILCRRRANEFWPAKNLA
jgi:tRNA pseudouridine55 synthase